MSIDDGDLDDGPGRRQKKLPLEGGDDHERLKPTIKNCPVKPLGKTGDQFVLMTPRGQIQYLRAADMTSPAVLAGLFDGDTWWLKSCFKGVREVAGFVGQWAGEWLMARCCDAGFFHAEHQVRGPGAWRLKSGEVLLLHLGDEIEVRRERGSPEVLAAGARYGGYIYTASRAEAKPSSDAASRDDVVDLYSFLDRWRYSHPEDPRVLLGWIGCAFLAGALRWRPHIWLTGDTSTGKSTLELVIRDLLGSSAMRASEPTKMAIAQQLAGAARPVLLDEFERDIDPVKQEQVVQLARLASTEDQAGIIRGSPEGRVRTYIIRGCFYFSGIVPAPLKPQDRTRIHVIDLRSLEGATREDVANVTRIGATMPKLGARLRARALEGFWRFQANERVFEQAIMNVWHKGGRIVDQMGTLLAMSEMMLRDDTIALADAEDLLRRFDEVKDDLLGRADEGEAQNCLQHLMTSAIKGEHAAKTVGEMIVGVRTSTADGSVISLSGDHKELLRHGMRVLWLGEGNDLALAIAHRHKGLDDLFADTHWAGGAWNGVLKRVADSFVPKDPVRFAGNLVRCRVLPFVRLPLATPPHPDDADRDDRVLPPEPSTSA